MKKRITLSLLMLLMTVFVFGEEKNKAIEKINLPNIEAKVTLMKTEKSEALLDIKVISTFATQKELSTEENCYGGMTSCNTGYMFCQEQPLSRGDQLIIWDAMDAAHCGS